MTQNALGIRKPLARRRRDSKIVADVRSYWMSQPKGPDKSELRRQLAEAAANTAKLAEPKKGARP